MNLHEQQQQIDDISKQIVDLQKHKQSLIEQYKKDKRIYDELNKNANERNRLLAGYNFQEIKNVIKVLLMAENRGYVEEFNINRIPEGLLDDDGFIDLCIIALGQSFITKYKKQGITTDIIDGGIAISKPKERNWFIESRRRLNRKLKRSEIKDYVQKFYDNGGERKYPIDQVHGKYEY